MKPYRSLRTLFLWASASMVVMSSSSLALNVAGAVGAFEDESMSDGTGLLTLGLVFALIASLVLGAISFGMWMSRASHNVRALGHTSLQISPAYGVGSFFIPILNLWKPYQAMQEIWRASLADRNGSWLSTPPGEVVKGWWGAWVAAGLAGRAVSSSESFGAIDVAVALLVFVAAALCITMMRAVAAGQEAQRTQDAQTVSVSDVVAHTPFAR
jgi:hypothetical protein